MRIHSPGRGGGRWWFGRAAIWNIVLLPSLDTLEVPEVLLIIIVVLEWVVLRVCSLEAARRHPREALHADHTEEDVEHDILSTAGRGQCVAHDEDAGQRRGRLVSIVVVLRGLDLRIAVGGVEGATSLAQEEILRPLLVHLPEGDGRVRAGEIVGQSFS